MKETTFHNPKAATLQYNKRSDLAKPQTSIRSGQSGDAAFKTN